MMSTPRVARFRLVLRPRPRLPPVTTAVLCVSDLIDLLTMEVFLSFVPLCFPSSFCGAAFCSFGPTISLKKIRNLFVANGDPMISRKFADNPFAAKAAETAILLPSKWSSKRFGEGGVVYVGHASLYSQRKPSASLDVAGKYRTGQPILGIICNAKCFRFPMDLTHRRTRPPALFLHPPHLFLH